MKASVFHSPKKIVYEEIPDPRIEEPNDIIVKVTSTAICGTDLHIYNGFLPQKKPMVLGHEFMGEVVETGKNSTRYRKGDRVVVPCLIACGHCYFCQHELPAHCENTNDKYGPEGRPPNDQGGGVFGYTDLYGGYNGGQAEYVRVPCANFGPRLIEPDLTDEQVLFLTDIFPTGWTAIERAQLKGGETVAVFGCGPVGIMTQKAAWLQGAGRVIGIDVLDYRLEIARKSGKAEVLNSKKMNVIEAIREMTDGRGADVCVDAVGMEANRNLGEKFSNLLHGQAGTINVFKECISAVRRGGVVSIIGVYGSDYAGFPLGQIFDKGLSVYTGAVILQPLLDELLDLVRKDKVSLDDIITHRFPLNQISHAYEIFCQKKDECLKVILTP
jgi:alcohol dehydrogenase